MGWPGPKWKVVLGGTVTFMVRKCFLFLFLSLGIYIKIYLACWVPWMVKVSNWSKCPLLRLVRPHFLHGVLEMEGSGGCLEASKQGAHNGAGWFVFEYWVNYWVCMYHITFQSIKYVYIYIFSIACEYAYIDSIYVAIIFLMVDLYISQYHEYL